MTKKEWWGLRVEPYAVRKEALSSSAEVARFCVNAMQVKSRPLNNTQISCSSHGKQKEEGDKVAREKAYRTSQTNPSVAVCFLVFNSLTTNS